jgi:putative membrane protein
MKGYITELKGIWSQKKMVIALLGIILMPLLYGGVLVWSFWDPYGQLDQLPVAVVNEDLGAEVEGEQIEAGAEFIEELKKDPALDFHFVSKKEAEQGLASHDYYFYVEIPESFSEDLISLKESNPVKANVFYEVNEEYNYVSSQIASNVIEEMEKELSETLTLAYVEVAHDAFSKLTEAVIALEEGSNEIADGNKNATESMERLSEGLVSLTSGSKELTTGVKKAAEGSDQLVSGIEQAKKELQTFNQANQANQANNVDAKFNETSQLLEQTINELEQADTKEAAVILDNLDNRLKNVNRQLNQADEQVQLVEEQIRGLKDSMEGMEQQINEVIHTINDYTDKLNQQMEMTHKELDEWNQNVKAAYEKVEQPLAELKKFQSQVEELPAILNNLYPEWREHEHLVSWYEDLQANVKRVEGLYKETAGAIETINNGFPELLNGLESRQIEWKQFNEELNKQIDQYSSKLNQFFEEATSKTDELLMVLDQLSRALQEAEAAIPDGLNGDQLTASFEEEYMNVLSALNKVNEKLNMASSLYQRGQAASEQAYKGVVDLNEGLHELVNGSNLLSESLVEASDGGNELFSGLHTLQDGSIDLALNMNQLKEALLEVDPNEKQESMLVSPVQSKNQSQTEDYSYGVGLSPYFLSIGLYVGGLTLSIIYPFREPLGEHQSGWEWFSGKLGVIYSVGVLQSSLVAIFLLYGLKLDVASKIGFFSFTIFTSLAFLSLIFFLVSVLDNPGRFAAIILLILQLGGSAGSFPVELLASPLQTLHGWLPMTYSVLGFRSVIFMGVNPLLWDSVRFLCILIIICTAGALVYFMVTHRKRNKKEYPTTSAAE